MIAESSCVTVGQLEEEGEAAVAGCPVDPVGVAAVAGWSWSGQADWTRGPGTRSRLGLG